MDSNYYIPQLPVLLFLSHACDIIIIYCVRQNFGGRKFWQIWGILPNLPKFSSFKIVTELPLKFTYKPVCRTLFLLRKPDFYEEYMESNILPQKVILLQLHITCEKSNLVILLFA